MTSQNKNQEDYLDTVTITDIKEFKQKFLNYHFTKNKAQLKFAYNPNFKSYFIDQDYYMTHKYCNKM